MKFYIPITVFLYFIVNFLLLTGTARMLRQRVGWLRVCLGATVSGLYALSCLIFNGTIVCSLPVYLISVINTSLLCYGFKRSSAVLCLVYSVLYLALGGVSVETRGLLSLLLGTIGVFLICYIMPSGFDRFEQVEIDYKNQHYSIRALRDTGNQLTDPLTGNPVLIVGADIAQAMTGLTADQLQNPVESLGLIPGLRLIPYKTVGQTGLFLLAMRINRIKIGTWQGSAVIAFSPVQLSAQGIYQALTGGNL